MRVLLIEDDSATAQSIDLMLKSEGFNVYVTDLGEEGVDLGKIYDFDIILLDLNLPDMNGFEVLKTLRTSKIGTPILILSGLAGIENKVRGLGFGYPCDHSPFEGPFRIRHQYRQAESEPRREDR
jgi:two-component system cell cycle response regulator CtrA